MKIYSAILLLCAAVLSANGADPNTRFRAGVMPAAPTLDGVINEKEWAGSVPVFGFKRYNSEALSYRQGYFRIGYTAKNLYFACRSELPPEGMKLR